MKEVSPWPLVLKYGLIVAFANIFLTLVFYLVNPNKADTSMSVMGAVQLLISVVVAIYLFMLAGKARRDQDLDGTITYAQSLGFMVLTALPASFIIAFFTYFFITYINPELMATVMDAQAEELAKSGKSDEEIEQTLKYARMFTGPLAMTIFGGIGAMFQMVIYALIASIFVKKEPITIE